MKQHIVSQLVLPPFRRLSWDNRGGRIGDEQQENAAS